jgi:2',3'-cyclic-nucleotide 2'-phosphodiesterase (5'-nucleotidase family)
LCEYQECSLGNLIADAMKDSTNTEIAFLCGGDIKNNILKGNLTNRQLIDVMPFYNNIIVKRIHGQVILDALEYGVSNFPNPFNAFPQVSGLRFDINPTINNAIKIESDKLNVDGERRVSNVKVNGKDLN